MGSIVGWGMQAPIQCFVFVVRLCILCTCLSNQEIVRRVEWLEEQSALGAAATAANEKSDQRKSDQTYGRTSLVSALPLQHSELRHQFASSLIPVVARRLEGCCYSCLSDAGHSLSLSVLVIQRDGSRAMRPVISVAIALCARPQ